MQAAETKVAWLSEERSLSGPGSPRIAVCRPALCSGTSAISSVQAPDGASEQGGLLGGIGRSHPFRLDADAADDVKLPQGRPFACG